MSLICHIHPDDTVDIVEQQGAITRSKTISLQAFADALITEFKLNTGLMPPGCRMYIKHGNREYLVIEAPELKRKLRFNQNTYDVVCPWTVMVLRLDLQPDGTRTVSDSRIYASKGPIIKEDAQLYRLPFSNVHPGDHRICWGGDQNAPTQHRYKSLIGLAGAIECFYGAVFNRDLDDGRFEAFMVDKVGPDGKEHKVPVAYTEGLMQHIHETGKFPYQVLRRASKINELIHDLGRESGVTR